jgi:undecaprenyl-diphosphatase
MSLLHALLLAILQGASELFPVSSLGHAVVIPALLGWRVDENGPGFLPFLVMLHLGTAVALLAYFWRDWFDLLAGAAGLGSPHRVAESRRVLGLIVVATLPAVMVGFALEHRLRALFGAPAIVALILVANGVLLAAVERLRGRSPSKTLAGLQVMDALIIGAWQCLALVPGFSRSGATIAGGLLRGVDHEGSAHFSFLIATPIILGATVLEVPKLRHDAVAPGIWSVSVVASVVAGVVAFLSTAFLMRWFRRDDTARLDPFAAYCALFGLAAFGLLVIR